MTTAEAPQQVDELLRSRRYIGVLILCAVLGAAISALAYGFLTLVHFVQQWMYSSLPHAAGFASVPIWWPVVPLALAGLVVGAVVRHLPGSGGEVPVDGFHAGPPPPARSLPGVALAALASIALGPVVGPEGPLIALGAGAAVMAVRFVRRDLPKQAATVIAATGSFAAISTLLGSPIVGAFLLMEITGLVGATATAVLVPGLLGAGIGALIFTGLGQLTGQGEFSLAIPNLPGAGRPTVGEFVWALVVGLVAAVLCWLIRRLATSIRSAVERHVLPATAVIGLLIAGLAIAFAAATGHDSADVLYSGQSQLPALLEHAGGYSVAALLMLIVCKGLAYAGSLTAFRGGPTFPAMFIGAAGGVALSHLPGLGLIPGAAIGIGAMLVAMLRLPMTAVLLTCLFLGADGVMVMPLVIVAVVVAHVATIRLTPAPALSDEADA